VRSELPVKKGTKADGPNSFSRLVAVMHRLRSPGGCPWDAEQDHESLKPYLIEEAYEVIEAMDGGNEQEFCEELGDLLLQVVFHAEIAGERKAFTIDDVVAAVSDKLVRRHPHVFGETEVLSSSEVLGNWSRIKAAERAERVEEGRLPSLLNGVPKTMPALLRAHRMGEKASSAGFDWPSPEAAREKLNEELAEADREFAAGNIEAAAAEIGDLLFAAANYLRLLGTNGETVLHRALERFGKRFESMERELRAAGIDPHDASAKEFERLWHRAKNLIKD
jgi:MazG family protein